jgi:acyl carrier protein
MDTLTQNPGVDDKEIFVVLRQFISEVIGEEFLEDIDITEQSSFTKDLEMDSIELVSFSEKVKKHFGQHIDFPGWLSKMDIDQMIGLTIRDIIQFIQQCRYSKSGI